MSIPETIARIAGLPRKTGAHQPIILDDPERIIIITQGYLDIFAVETASDLPLHRHPFVARIPAGQAAFGGPALPDASALEGGGSMAFLAVPSLDAMIAETDRTRFNAKELPHIHAVILIDEWISSLSGLLARRKYLLPRNAQLLEADPGVPYSAGSVVSAHHLDVIWISANRPTRFIGNDNFTVAAETLLPLSERTWLQLDTDTEISALHTTALVGSSQLWSALDCFNTLLLQLASIVHDQVIESGQENYRASQAHQVVARAKILQNIGTVLMPIKSGEMLLETGDPTPLHTVTKLVAESVGGVPIAAKDDHEVNESVDLGQTLASLARLSDLRTRAISLANGWFTRDGPSFVGHTADGSRPLAILSDGRGAYRAVDSVAGRTYAVDSKTIDGIARRGFMLYAPLPNSIKSGLAALLHVLRQFGRDFNLLLAMAILSSLLALLTPILTGKLLAEIIPRGDTEMWVAALSALALGALGAAIFDIVGALATLRIEGRTDERLQAAVWSRLVSLPTSFFRCFTAGDLADRATGIGQVRQLLTGATVHGLISGVLSVSSFALLFYYSWTLALCAGGISVALIFGSWFLVRHQVRHYRTAFHAQGLIDGFVFQMITGVGKLRMANAEHYALVLWAQRFANQRRAILSARLWGAGQHAVNAMFMSLSLLILFAFIWYSLIEGKTQQSFNLADFLSFNAAFGQFAAAMVALTGSWTAISNAVPLFERVQPLLECEPENVTGSFVPMDLAGHIEFADVTFRYLADAPNALNNVSFQIRQGEYVAFVGPSGSGKSTIYRLLLGFERPDSGAVQIDGHDLLHLDLPTVRNLMGVVLQDGKLVAASIFENISGASPLTMEEAWAAARAAGLEDDVRSMPMGMHTVLQDGGVGLSGGQRQRVLIARALARKPRIMLFDEATSALDNRTQRIVQESLRTFNTTRIVIAHRLSTIRDADRIFVMKEGQLVETGRYDTLMAQDGVFADLARRQVL